MDFEGVLRNVGLQGTLSVDNPEFVIVLRQAKAMGFSDRQLATMWKRKEIDIRKMRKKAGIIPSYKLVDTCAAEFEAYTPYYYSTYDTENEARVSDKRKVVILGGGPNRIGQGIEFDYCCVHASYALREMGIESIMVNSNPETVSTDYDTSDRLYFEPLTREDVLAIIEQEKPEESSSSSAGRPRSIWRCRSCARSADSRYLAGFHRPRRGPRALPGPAPETRSLAARKRHGHERRGGRGRGRAHRLPGGGAALVRARRAGHGHRL